MKILHICPRWTGGGPERNIVALAKLARESGQAFEESVLVLDKPVNPRLLVAARRAGLRMTIAPEPDAVAGAIAGADLVLVHFWNHPALWALLRDFEWPPARVILNVCVLGNGAPQVVPAELGTFADALFLTSRLSRATGAAVAARARGKAVAVLLSIADMDRLEYFAARPHPGVVVGYLGTVNGSKMHPRFVEMASALRDDTVRFLVCGGGGGEARLAEHADSLGLAGRFEVTGPIEDIADAFSRMDVFGYPLAEYTYATSEKAVQEAMWVGLPPVVMAYGGLPALVRHERTGLLARTESEYVAALNRLVSDPALRRRLGEAARAYARRHFDPRRNAVAHWSQYRDTLRQAKRTRTRLQASCASRAGGFVQSLGEYAGAFATSLRGTGAPADLDRAHRVIAHANPLLSQGEGGVLHYRNAYPEDPHLRFWAALLLQQARRCDQAEAEFGAALARGLPERLLAGRSLSEVVNSGPESTCRCR
ncbi:MAG: glycosyltransferase family 4 protein [Hydrogenophilales bacterium]|nr:glycosyltransferase family 4 protein [Hydrogenophilales bacterium]